MLAFARLAPVQCATWGHPVTTGIPTIDYFISNVDAEPADAAEHYTEQLVRMKNLPTYYAPPSVSSATRSRKDFGLEEKAHLYLCPQSLFKMHPEFDGILSAILRADPKGRIVLVNGRYQNTQGRSKSPTRRALKVPRRCEHAQVPFRNREKMAMGPESFRVNTANHNRF